MMARETGGLAQLARAPALQAGGHRFDSDILHKKKFFQTDLDVTWDEGRQVDWFETDTSALILKWNPSGSEWTRKGGGSGR